jgi:hypothetical protein
VLAPLAGINVAPGSIIQARPPAPDIQCDVVGIGHMNFELLALDDESTRKRLSNMFNTKSAWARSLRGIPPAELARIQAEFANVHLSVHFDEMAGTRLPARLHSVSIFRTKRTDGANVSAPSAGYWMPPQLNKIEKKLLEKSYTFTALVELFAYSPHDEPDGHINSLDEIQACINRNLPGSLFTRVHVFNLGFLKHIVTIP